MWRAFRWGWVLLLLAVSAGWATQEVVPPAGDKAAARPRLEIEQDSLDLGEVHRGDPVEATFVVRNVGGETLRILSVKPG